MLAIVFRYIYLIVVTTKCLCSNIAHINSEWSVNVVSLNMALFSYGYYVAECVTRALGIYVHVIL